MVRVRDFHKLVIGRFLRHRDTILIGVALTRDAHQRGYGHSDGWRCVFQRIVVHRIRPNTIWVLLSLGGQ